MTVLEIMAKINAGEVVTLPHDNLNTFMREMTVHAVRGDIRVRCKYGVCELSGAATTTEGERDGR